MLTDTIRRRTDARNFALRAVAASLGLFGLLRLSWTEQHVLLPVTRTQGRLAEGLFGTPALPIEVTLACSGADTLALCLGAVLAYPVTWRMRLGGAGAGVVLILALNTLRIGSLGAASPAWFNAFHLYLWPALLTLAIAGFVFTWMRLADRRHTLEEGDVRPRADGQARWVLTRRFVVLTIAFVIAFSTGSAIYLESPTVLALAGFIANAAALMLSTIGVTAHAAENVLWTNSGGFLVTQECISTPLIPIYLAGVCTYATTWRRLVAGVAAALPLFVALGIARLLVVALPEAVSPIFFVHAFYQLLLAAVVVFLAALWRHGGRAALGHGLVGVAVGVAFVQLLGPSYTRLITFDNGVTASDPQGALALLPAFQVGLYLALWTAAFVAVGWTRFFAGLAMLGITQATGLLALNALAGYSGMTTHVRDIRGWAVAGPVLVFATVVTLARARR